jgi:hypothetical protein
MKSLVILFLFLVCIVCLGVAGCITPEQSGNSIQKSLPTQQSTILSKNPSSSGEQYYVGITTLQQGKNLILTYQGGQDADKLLYCTVMINKIEQSKRLGNTPGDWITLENVGTKAQDHVEVIGHFKDGSSQIVMDVRV